MKSGSLKLAIYGGVIVLSAILVAPAASTAKLQTLTGTVGDAVCGVKHTMDGDDIYCLRTCIRRGSKYDLIVGDKVYVLNLKDQAIADTLDQLAIRQARAVIKGAMNGETIEVDSVTAAK